MAPPLAGGVASTRVASDQAAGAPPTSIGSSSASAIATVSPRNAANARRATSRCRLFHSACSRAGAAPSLVSLALGNGVGAPTGASLGAPLTVGACAHVGCRLGRPGDPAVGTPVTGPAGAAVGQPITSAHQSKTLEP